jgi:signal transduction histidine kinase
MDDRPQTVHQLKPQELEAVYAISKIVTEEVSLDKALARIINIAREVLVFDSAIVYLQEDANQLEPFFAKAIGRGRSSGHTLPWGETAAMKAAETGKTYINESVVDPNGDRLDHHFYLSLPLQAGGSVSGAIVFIRFGGPEYQQDHINLAGFITAHISQLFEQKRLVNKIANLQAEQRLAQLQDEFVAMVSHELKTPLGFIKGYTTTLLRQDTTWDPATQLEFLNIIDEEADLLSEQIENLLNSFRLKSRTIEIKPTKIQLAAFIESILDKVSTQEVNLEINLAVLPTDLEVVADGKMLSQVITNLISNAVKYAPGSTLKIQVRSYRDCIRFTFQDTGPGIPPHHIERIFDQFYRVPERSGGVRGAGLGLFICKQIIEAHNGKIWVQSEPDKGTSFIFEIPKYQEPPENQKDGEDGAKNTDS